MRILIFTNTSGNRYGYSVVGDNIAQGLQEAGHQVFYLGMQSIHPPYKGKDGIVYLGIKTDPFGSDVLKTYIEAYKIDVLLTMWDVWLPHASYLPGVVEDTGVKWVLHLTVNSVPLSPYFTVLPKADIIVAPSKFVFEEVDNAGFNNVHYIPHGVDLDIYKPDDKKNDDDKFVFLNVGRNKGLQKNFPGMLQAYRTMLDKHPTCIDKSILMLLTDSTESEGVHIKNFVNKFGLQNHVGFIGWSPKDDLTGIQAELEQDGFPHFANCNLPETEMSKLYNMCDCYISASSGESFGLPILEAQACGKPVIAVNNSTGPELIGIPGSGLLADTGQVQMTPLISNVYHVNIDSLADCMWRMYSDRNLRDKCSEKAIDNANGYNWDIIREHWVNIINSIDLVGETDYYNGVSGL